MDNKKKSLLTKTYIQFRDAGLGKEGLSSIPKIVDKEITGFGTSIGEKIQGIPELKALLRNQIKQSKDIPLKWKIKPFSRYITEDENTAVYADDILLNINTGKELIKMHLRFSIVLNYIGDKWKVIHWHGSKLEQVPGEEGTIDIKNLQQKNTKLEKLVRDKTADLKVKERELDIEAALEKVRSRAMAMHTSGELKDVAAELRKQMGVMAQPELEVCAIHLYDEWPDCIEAWAAVPVLKEKGKIIQVQVMFPKHGIKILEESMKQYHAGKKDYMLINKGLKALQWLNLLKEKVPEGYALILQNLNGTAPEKSVTYWSMADFQGGSLVMTTYIPPNEYARQLLRRFANVFGLAYRRFIELKNAEAQAREAKIETALENVRNRSLSMQNSNELPAVAEMVFEKLRELKFAVSEGAVGILAFQEGSKDHTQWIADKDHTYPHNFFTPHTEHRMSADLIAAKESGIGYFSKLYPFEEKNEYFNYLFQYSDYKVLPNEIKQLILSSKQYGFSVAIEKNSAILVPTNQGRLLGQDEADILKRFARVFEQVYIRFLDIQKAEAQAREAQIESALESVRASSMAMHHSVELENVVKTLAVKLTDLGLTLDGALIFFYDREKRNISLWIATNQLPAPIKVEIPYDRDIQSNLIIKDLWEVFETGNAFLNKSYTGKIKNDYFHFVVKNNLSKIPEPVRDFQQKAKRWTFSAVAGKNSVLSIDTWYEKCITQQDFIVLKRFSKAFEQCYTRFLDLQQAEAQAREGQIEAALERVRSRSMGMQKSEELREVIRIVYEQLIQLNIHVEHAGFLIDYKTRDDLHIWLADEHLAPSEVIFPWFDCPPNNAIREAKEKGEEFFFYKLNFEEKNKFYRDLFKLIPGIPEETVDYYFQCPGLAGSGVLLESIGLYIENFSGTVYTEEENAVLMRFGKVFQQTYTRFLDLQKAEAQAKEGQIQLALERVRARTMAMQKSDELSEASNVLFQQLKVLGEEIDQISIIIFEKIHTEMTVYATTHGNQWTHAAKIPLNKHSVYQQVFTGWKNQKNSLVIDIEGEELKALNKFKLENPDYQVTAEDLPKDRWIIYNAYFSKGSLGICSTTPKSEESIHLYVRFAQVFDLTYTRFLDLQKAEAQAREAKIQLALERVRARTMAMQKSDELSEASNVLFQQLKDLGEEIEQISICIFEEDLTLVTLYTTIHGKQWTHAAKIALNKHTVYQQMFSGWKNHLKSLVIDIGGEELKALNKFKLEHPDYQVTAEDLAKDRWIINNAYFSKGTLGICTIIPRPEESVRLYERFAQVFDLTYRRFLDLQKSEAQAREARIEVALEKVRASTMSMNKSADLANTAAILFEQLRILGDPPDRMSIGIIHEPEGIADMWLTDQAGEMIDTRYILDLKEKTVVQKLFKGWRAGKKSTIVDLKGEEFERWLKYVRSTGLIVKDEHFKNRRVHTVAFFNYGWLNISSLEPVRAEMINILERFAAVYNLTYTRFLDLQKAEANAKEAIKQSALDRLRADIASMRTVSDLDRITPLIWNELTTLNIPFIRCGVFIMNETQQIIHTYLSTPDGKAIAAFHLPFDIPGNMAKVLSHWKEHKKYIDHWDQLAFNEMADILVKQGAISTPDEYLDAIPLGGFYLHFLPFLQGMLYVGNSLQLGEEDIQLIQHLADAFSTAYARYEDFNKLEAAKKQVDSTLTELQATQRQLIQSEKMASLGELTAGIAHEIQNPLNFVNNFSEVSKELLDEMKEAIEKGNTDDATTIMNDVILNLEKINHHGKRADGIVKGMLQHSRSSTGQKELTDINVLCDEYLRLAYHGLRAKDKSFSAKFEAVFDDALPKINIVPQEIGRVLLNLINNAFYAVREKQKQNISDYEPIVIVTTKKDGDKILFTVKDNGNGIPEKIKDKIFQPFFTTKPTGSGTGLGLSLAYDIVTKGHGGELKVETSEGEGSEFVIMLPVV